MEKELILNYYEAAEIQMNATYSGDYKKGNRASDKLKEYNDLMKSDSQKYEPVVKELLSSENPNVVIWIAEVALENNFEKDAAICKLKKIAENKELGIIRLNAEMTLKTRNLW